MSSTDLVLYRYERLESPMSYMLAAQIKRIARRKQVSYTVLADCVINLHEYFLEEVEHERVIFIEDPSGIRMNYTLEELSAPIVGDGEYSCKQYVWLSVNMHSESSILLRKAQDTLGLNRFELFYRMAWLYVRMTYWYGAGYIISTQALDGSRRHEIELMI